MNSIKWFVKEILSRDGSLSSKRFWGGILIVNAVVLSYTHTTAEELIGSFLLFGTGLLGLGLGEQIQKRVADKMKKVEDNEK